MAPACFLVAALGSEYVRSWGAARFSRKVCGIAAVLFAAIVTGEVCVSYFRTFARNPSTRMAFEGDWVDLGREIRSLPRGPAKYVIMVGVPLDEKGNPRDFYSLAVMTGGFSRSTRAYRNIHFVVTPEEAERASHEQGAYAYVIRR